MSLKTVKVQIGFELYIFFWDFTVCPKLCWSSRSDTFRKQIDTNKNKFKLMFGLWRFNFIFGKLCLNWSHFFLYVCFKSILDVFSEFQLGICFESFFFLNKSILDCIFWSPIWKVFGSKLTNVHFGFCFWFQTDFGFILEFKPVLDFLFAFKSLLDWMFSVQMHFAFFWGLKFKYILDFVCGFNSIWDFFKVSKINFGISVLSF